MYVAGDHLYFSGAFRVPALFHHGVYVGDGQVVHFWGRMPYKSDARVMAVPVAVFEQLAKNVGSRVLVLNVASRLPRDKTVRRALSRVGEGGYNVATNNCEHFANWCVQGVAYSAQINYQLKRTPRDARATLVLKPSHRVKTGSDSKTQFMFVEKLN